MVPWYPPYVTPLATRNGNAQIFRSMPSINLSRRSMFKPAMTESKRGWEQMQQGTWEAAWRGIGRSEEITNVHGNKNGNVNVIKITI